MNDVIEQIPNIIAEASKSPLGIFALMIIALSILGYYFFRKASEGARIGTFVLMLLGVALFGYVILGAPPTEEEPSSESHTFNVVKGSNGTPLTTNIRISDGDKLTITSTGNIWSGVFATGENGPKGWFDASLPKDREADENHPVPGVPPFSLIAGYDNAGWFYVGDSKTVTFDQDSRATLWLSINDIDHKRGSGFFIVNVLIERKL
jgi:hypothetical protein